VTPKRIQMTRQRPWRADNPDAVIVDRRTKWGNPYRVVPRHYLHLGRHAIGWYVLDREQMIRVTASTKPEAVAEAVRLFREHYTDEETGAPWAAREELRGRDLACWCKPGDPCHADVLLEIANGDVS